MLGIGFGLCIATNIALADFRSDDDRNKDDRDKLEQITPQWWQWAMSIPAPQNPLNDANCVIGQRGSVWFLGGRTFSGTSTRNCSIPAGTTLFFPVINQIGYNSPGCGQGPENISAKEFRKAIGDFIGSVRLGDLSVELDSKSIKDFERVRSEVFAIALPEEPNIAFCPKGIYSPAVDDGYYVKLEPLKVGPHKLRIRVTAPFSIDVTYNLTVVRVSDK